MQPDLKLYIIIVNLKCNVRLTLGVRPVGMSGIPPYLAFLFGGLIGALTYGPVRRWVVTMLRERSHQGENADARSDDSRVLLMIFATMHPAPWLFICGVPFALYQLILGPLPMMWLRLIVGMMMMMALLFLYEARLAGQSRH